MHNTKGISDETSELLMLMNQNSTLKWKTPFWFFESKDHHTQISIDISLTYLQKFWTILCQLNTATYAILKLSLRLHFKHDKTLTKTWFYRPETYSHIYWTNDSNRRLGISGRQTLWSSDRSRSWGVRLPMSNAT